jgi:hypothetical protein
MHGPNARGQLTEPMRASSLEAYPLSNPTPTGKVQAVHTLNFLYRLYRFT